MICPQCAGNGFIQLSGATEGTVSSQYPLVELSEMNCPTCEGQGELSDVPALNHCPACGEPLRDEQRWCDEHRAAGLFEVPNYSALCVSCNGNGFNEISERLSL
jgi:RecJ-like exonuclease